MQSIAQKQNLNSLAAALSPTTVFFWWLILVLIVSKPDGFPHLLCHPKNKAPFSWACIAPSLELWFPSEMALELVAHLGAQKQRLKEEMKAQNGEENETSCLENDSLALLMNVPCSLQVLSLPRFPSPSSQTGAFLLCLSELKIKLQFHFLQGLQPWPCHDCSVKKEAEYENESWDCRGSSAKDQDSTGKTLPARSGIIISSTSDFTMLMAQLIQLLGK